MSTNSVPTLLHVYPTFDLGGVQRRFLQLVNHFGAEYRHLIVSMDGRAEAFPLVGAQVDARMIEVPRRANDTLASVKTFRSVLNDLKPDLLVTSNWGTIEWAMANLDGRFRHLHMEDGFGSEEAARQLPRRVWTRRLVLRRSTVMLPSMTLYRLAREVWRLPQKRLVQVPNGIDCQRFTARPDTAFATSLGIAADRPVIGTVAALRSEKNLVRLIDAFGLVVRHRPAQLVIVGDGAQRAPLEQHAAGLGLSGQVLFTGGCSTPERLLPSFTLFALSSDTEQMPISVLEAMAAGRPVVSTDVGDVSQMVAQENRPYMTALDPGALAAAMTSLLDDSGLAGAIGAANALRAQKIYDQEKMFDAYRRLYDGRLPVGSAGNLGAA